MRVPISWLREFVALPPDSYGDCRPAGDARLSGRRRSSSVRRSPASLPVASRASPNIPTPIVWRSRRSTSAGDAPLTIATAATNVAAGQTIAVATIGARLPELTIAPRTMRGIASQGMMISAEELALCPAEWFEDGIMQLEPGVAPGLDAVELFGLDTAVLDVEITTNRPDAMSMLGLARELAASYGVPLAPSVLRQSRTRGRAFRERARVTIESPDCTRFVAQRIRWRCALLPRRRGCASGSRLRDSARSTTSSTSRTT